MNRLLSKPIHLLLLIGLCVSAIQAHAQRTKTFEGGYNVGNTMFFAEFDYYLSRGDTLRQGKFNLNRPVEDTDEFSLLAVKGHFKRNKPDGEWSLQLGNLSPVGSGIIRDYSYSFKVSGKESIAMGQLLDNNKEGTWSLYERGIVHSEVVDTLFYANFPFKENMIVGELSVYSSEKHFKGTIDENSFATGTWTFFTTDDLEGQEKPIKEWVFDGNVMVEKALYRADERVNLQIIQGFDTEAVEVVEMEIDADYFRILDLITNVQDGDKTKQFNEMKGIDEDFYSQAIQRFEPIDSALQAIAGINVSQPIKVKVNKFPYTDTEFELLEKIERKILETDSVILSIQKDPQINLAKISTPQVAWYSDVLQTLKSQMLEPIDSLIVLHEDGFLEYLNRDHFIEKIVELDEELLVKSTEKGKEISKRYQFKNFKIDENDRPVRQLSKFADTVLSEVQHISDSLDFYVFELKKEEKLVEFEKVLIEKFEEVKALNDSIITNDHDVLAGFDVGATIRAFVDREVSNYSSIASTEEKMDKVEALIDCLRKAEGLIHSVERSVDNSFTIRDAYTKQIFNPYTMTNMEEKVKGPIYKAYERMLLPGIFENLNKLSCGNIAPYTRNFETLFSNMIDVLKRETRKEEKRIKRADDPQKAADILGFKLMYN